MWQQFTKAVFHTLHMFTVQWNIVNIDQFVPVETTTFSMYNFQHWTFVASPQTIYHAFKLFSLTARGSGKLNGRSYPFHLKCKHKQLVCRWDILCTPAVISTQRGDDYAIGTTFIIFAAKSSDHSCLLETVDSCKWLQCITEQNDGTFKHKNASKM